jgi:hypothetical protein
VAVQRAVKLVVCVVIGVAVLNLAVFVHSAYADDPPVINDFGGSEGPFVWTFSGTLEAPNPVGMVITFGGLLEGKSVTVTDPGAHFQYFDAMTESGTVTAQTTGSETASFFVSL